MTVGMSGAEMLIKNVLKMLGVKAEDILGPLAQIRDKVLDADTRMNKMQADIEAIKKHLNVKDAYNGFSGTEHKRIEG